jgi:HD-GYP domain-containing protein (c-di-GMP phosphodiesterase class II)
VLLALGLAKHKWKIARSCQEKVDQTGRPRPHIDHRPLRAHAPSTKRREVAGSAWNQRSTVPWRRWVTSPISCPRYLVGHSSGVAELAVQAGGRCGLGAAELVTLGRAAFVHDVGRVAFPTRIRQKPGPLTSDEWECVRLHAYHSARVIARALFLAALARVATAHHERPDGSG